MAAISQKIANLLGGVSQQPDPVKLPGQVRAADNVYLDPTFGCRKRPGTEYLATLGSNIPVDARWFTIFRDNNERYVVAMYNNPTFGLRVWDLNDGAERTVTISDSATAYFEDASNDTVEQISIADYTMITNTNRIVSMSSTESPDSNTDALVTIDQISYNSNYNIDFSDAGAAPTPVYSATGLEVIPGTFEVQDGGLCSLVDAQNFTESGPGGRSGLQFRISSQCAAYLSGDAGIEYKPSSFNTIFNPTSGSSSVTEDFGTFKVVWNGFGGDFIIDAQWLSSDPKGTTYTGNLGGKVKITRAEERGFSTQQYVSRYTVDVILQNGGVGWRVGDVVNVVMQGKTYAVRVTKETFIYAYNNLGTATYTTPADTSSGVLSVATVTSSLVSAINGSIAGFTAEAVGNVIKISRTGGGEYNIAVRGGTTNTSMTALKGVARDVADLPSQGWDGFVIKVNNTDDETADDYYVQFETQSAGVPGAGSWTETVAPGIKTTINSSTMPHALIRQADGTFTLDALNSDSAFGGWAPRVVGDEDTNPEPSFVGHTITNMFFYANRLGFLSQDAVVMSQPGDYFNFFSASALTVSDVDPIDLTASATKPAILKAAVGTAKGLILFAESSQFLLSTDEVVFSSATAKLKEISNYFYRSRVIPLNSGVSVSFISESNTYSKVLEMAVDSVQNRPVVADITRIIPEYLPSSLEWGAVSANNNFLVFGNKSQDVYTFKFFNNGDERQLAGWTRWIFPDPVELWAFEDDKCFIVTRDETSHHLLTSKLTDDPADAPLSVGFSAFTPRLDYQLNDTEFTPVVGQVSTRIDLPAQFIDKTPVVFIATGGDYTGYFATPDVQDDAGTKYIEVPNAVATGEWRLGLQYTSSVELPAIFTTAEGRADRVNIPMVEFLYLNLYYSGRYEAVLSKRGYDTSTRSLEVTPANVYVADQPTVQELGTAVVPLFAPGDIVNLTINCPDPFPSSITSYSWQGHYNNRGIRPLR